MNPIQSLPDPYASGQPTLPPAASPGVPALPAATPAIAPPLALSAPTGDGGTTPAGPPATTSDEGLMQELDREWVNKARAIVDQTRSDPYMQSRGIGKVRADYLKVRFDKHIKVDEDSQ